jgi:hypothetical protein
MTDELPEYVAICAACGYQWNSPATTITFNRVTAATGGAHLNCQKRHPELEQPNRQEYAGNPWY